MKKKSGIAFYDFDGTITTHDTMLELAKYKTGRVRYLILLSLLVPHFLLYKSKLISNTRFKELFLRLFFGGMPINAFHQLASEFCELKLETFIRPKAFANIKSQLSNDIQVVIVTASASIWVAPWCKKYGLGLIASELEVVNDSITGKLLGKNCHGPEKVSRIKAAFDLTSFEKVLAYGDSSGDRPMLDLATESFFRPFEK